MATSMSTSYSKEGSPPPASPPTGEPLRRQWGEPGVAGPIICSLVIALFGVGVVAFQSLKDDIRATETRLVADLKDFRAELKADNANLRAELKADNRALNDKLDRVLENLRP